MKHYLLLSIFICLWGSPSYAQLVEPPVFEWAESLGGPGSDSVNDWIIGPDGSIYLTGTYLYWHRFGDSISTTTPWAGSQEDAYLMKIGPDLQLDWSVNIGGPYNDSGRGIEMDTEGNLWWVGDYQGNIAIGKDSLYGFIVDSNSVRIQNKIFCAKINPESGQIDSSFSFGGYDYARVENIALGGQGELIFFGFIYISPEFIFAGDTIPVGSKEWSNYFIVEYHPQKNESQFSFISDPQGGTLSIAATGVNYNDDIHLVGSVERNLVFQNTPLYEGDFRKFHIVLGNNDSLKLFQTFPKKVDIDKVVFDSWNNYYLIGEANRFLSEETNFYPYQEGMSPGIIIQKSNPDGLDPKWLNFRGESTSHVSALTQGENLVLAGTYTDSLLFNEIILRPPENSVNKRDAFVAKVDREGKTIWARTAGGEYGEAILDIKEREESQYVVMGHMETGFTFMDTFFLSQPFVLPYEFDHFLGILSKDLSGPPLPYISGDPESQFILFPNPSSGNLTIWGAFENDQWQLQLFDQAGRLVWEQTSQTRTGQTRLPIAIQSIAPGIYHLVCNSQSERFTTSIMIE